MDQILQKQESHIPMILKAAAVVACLVLLISSGYYIRIRYFSNALNQALSPYQEDINRYDTWLRPTVKLLNFSERKINLAAIALMIAKEKYKIKARDYLRALDIMALQIQENIKDEMHPKLVIDCISNYLYKKEKFLSTPDFWDAKNFQLHFVMDFREGNSLGLSILWLSLAERLYWRGRALPIYPVLVPNHIFCRWDDGYHKYNIETLHISEKNSKETLDINLWLSKNPGNAGEHFSDEFYQKKYNISPKAIEQGYYLISISKKQLASCIYSNCAAVEMNEWKKEKKWQKRLELQIKIQKKLYWARNYHSRNLMVLYQQSKFWIYRHQYQKALNILRRIQDINPSAKTFAAIASIYISLKDYKVAFLYLRSAEKCPATGKINTYIIYLKAYLYYVTDNNKKAIELCKKILKKNHRRTYLTEETARLLLEIYLQNKEYSKALQMIRFVEKILSDSAFVDFSRGKIYENQGKWEKAKNFYEKALRKNSSSAEAHSGLGHCYFQQKKYQKALYHYSKSLSYNPELRESREKLMEVKKIMRLKPVLPDPQKK